jgi:PelA/Pel-15E family pectate lyase
MKKPLLIALLLLLGGTVNRLPAQESQQIPSMEPFRDGIHHWNLEHKDRNYPRLDEADYLSIARQFVAYQNEDGGWPKNIDWLAQLPVDSVKTALKERYRLSTLDNRNTFPQIAYLAEVYRLSHEELFQEAALKGLRYLLSTQKSNGGWRGWDVDAVTFNDEVTTGALELFQQITLGDERFSWLDEEMRAQIADGYARGIALILRCQVVQQGVKTAWAQQHDNETFLPVKARTYELPGITANESCDVLRLLMKIPSPAPEVVEAIESAMAWLRRSIIPNLRIVEVPLSEEKIINHEYPFDRVEVVDSLAPPIWARFYEVEDNTPFLCTRAGVKVWKLADVNAERRTGYDWYGYWPNELLPMYDEWKEKNHIK